MKFVIKLLLPLSLAFLSHAQTVLRFQQHINPQAAFLGDILQISQDKNAWRELPLDSHPKDGEHISKQQIMHWLMNKTGAFAYQWRGKSHVVVHQQNQTSGSELIQKAEETLLHELKKHYDSVALSTKTQLKDSQYPLAEFTVALPVITPLAKHLCVPLHHAKQELRVWFSVKAYQEVLIAKHPIKEQQKVQSSDFIKKKCNIAGLKNVPYTQLKHSMWLQKHLNKNQILTHSQLAPLPCVIKGQAVAVNVLNHGISITVAAVAESNGCKGQVIRLKNPQSNKYFSAQIIAANQAEIRS